MVCKHKFFSKFVWSAILFVALGVFYFSFTRTKSNKIPLRVLFASPQKSAPTISPDQDF